MDNLSLRRSLYQDPTSLTAAQLQDEPQLQQLQQELLELDAQLKEQLQIEAPPHLAEQILLNQRMLPAPRRWYHQTFPYATAAAVLIAVLYWQMPSPHQETDLGQHALTHVYHELAALGTTVVLEQSALEPLFAEMGIRADLTVPIKYARFCEFDGIRSLHLIVEFKGKPLTVFVLPDQHDILPIGTSQFADARFFGQALAMDKHRLLVVAEYPQLLAEAGHMLKKSLYFNI